MKRYTAHVPGCRHSLCNGCAEYAVDKNGDVVMEEDYAVVEQRLRSAMWRSHGHTVYGDDGEMQCSECAQFGCWDYKNAPLEEVQKAYDLAVMERASKLQQIDNPEYTETTRQFQCGGCLGEFWLRDGIDPKCCPHCESPPSEIQTKDFGEYRQ